VGNSKPVKISEDMHEDLRKEAFNKRTTMKEIVEKALAKHLDSEQ
jgi:hypothetical protein